MRAERRSPARRSLPVIVAGFVGDRDDDDGSRSPLKGEAVIVPRHSSRSPRLVSEGRVSAPTDRRSFGRGKVPVVLIGRPSEW
jgi:hypothetical protein